MNKKTGLTLRIILGGYLVFLGVSILIQAIQVHPSDFALKIFFSAAFILIGGGYAFIQIREIYKMLKDIPKDTTEPDGADSNSEPYFEKPQHDNSLFRTAPMPSQDEIQREMETQETEKADEIESDYEEK